MKASGRSSGAEQEGEAESGDQQRTQEQVTRECTIHRGREHPGQTGQDQGPGNTIREEGQEKRGESVEDRAWTEASRAEQRTTSGCSVWGSGPSAPDGKIRGEAKKHDAAPWTGASGRTRAASPKWNVRGRTSRRSAERRSKLICSERKNKTARDGGSSGESQPTQGHPGQPGTRPSNTNSKEGDKNRDKGGVYGYERAKERPGQGQPGRAGRSKRRNGRRISQRTEPDAKHPGQSGAQPRTGSSGGVRPGPRTGTSGAGPRNKMAPPWTGTAGGPRSQQRTLTTEHPGMKANSGEPANTRALTGDKIKDRAAQSVKRGMKTKTREAHEWNTQGGAVHSPGLKHQSRGQETR